MSDNPFRIPFHVGGPKVMESDTQFSIYVSRALDCLGKSQNMIKFRVECYTENERCYNIQTGNTFSNLIAGSKGEGLTAPFESDIDLMSVYNAVICADNTDPFRSLPALYTVFEVDRLNTSPGYTKLKLDQSRARTSEFCNHANSLLKDGFGNINMSSDCFVEYLKNTLNIFDRSGPSIPSVVFFSQDHVLAFPCICQEITQSFVARHRNYGWPTIDQLTEIASLEGHVVPVGYKGSETAHLEWRICYTKSERLLMRSLNDTQTKTYILLKMVAKTYIKLVCKDITSYVLKNIVLWRAECVNPDAFNEELLVNNFIQTLCFLRNCIINNSLPSYMIPERNLLSVKLDLGQRQNIIILLTELINKGGGLLMGCESLRDTMLLLYKTPALAEQYRWKRDMIEKLQLRQDNIINAKSNTGCTKEQLCQLWSTDEAYSIIIQRLDDLIMPDKMSLALHGHDAWSLFSIHFKRLKQWLSG